MRKTEEEMAKQRARMQKSCYHCGLRFDVGDHSKCGEAVTRIRLLVNIPVNRKYGCKAGRVFEVLREDKGHRRAVRWWVRGDTGVEVGVLSHEAEVIEEA